MSIYRECSAAARALCENPDLRPVSINAPTGIITELDVILLAARTAAIEGSPWSEVTMRVAQREAFQVMNRMWHKGFFVRFGPVEVPGLSHPDYVRVASKFAHAPTNGPTRIVTPNGTFGCLTSEDRVEGAPGRKAGAVRDDLLPWAEQDIFRPEPVDSFLQRENWRLEATNVGLRAELDAAQAELQRLRKHVAEVASHDGVSRRR